MRNHLHPTHDRDERDRSGYAIQQVLRPSLADFPDYRAAFVQDQGGSLRLGHHRPIRRPRSRRRERSQPNAWPPSMNRLDSLTDVRSTSALRRPEIQIRPRQEDMARLGVTSASVRIRHSHRHQRRRRTEPAEVRSRRSPNSDPHDPALLTVAGSRRNPLAAGAIEHSAHRCASMRCPTFSSRSAKRRSNAAIANARSLSAQTWCRASN
jgi:hypothetical protein